MIKVEMIVRIMCSDMKYAICIECVVHFVGIVVEYFMKSDAVH